MVNKFNIILGGLLILSGCTGFEPYTTVSKINKPPTRTIETKLQTNEVANSAGTNIHNYMERLAAQITTSEGVNLISYQEGFRIILNSELLFSDESHTLQKSPECLDVFNTIKESPYVNYLLEIHTDGEGTRYYNQSLSERRAESIKSLFTELAFPLDRLELKAYGEDQPIAENSFEWGKFLNRRIEIAVFASENLKELAQKGPVY